MQALQHLPQRRACRCHNRSVEGVADWQLHDVESALQEHLCNFCDRLASAVNVGNDGIALHRLENLFNLGEWREHRYHFPFVFHRYLGHATAAGADRLECFFKVHRSGGD